MVEVVQDLLDHVAYAGGLSRRRVDAVRGFAAGTPRPGEFEYVVTKGDPSSEPGPRIRRLREFAFDEMLDRAFEEKSYRAQLQEFAYRGAHIVSQVDRKFGEVQQLIDHDVLRRSRCLPELLRTTCDELHRAHALICGELEEVWHVRFEPFFYPSDKVSKVPESPTPLVDMSPSAASGLRPPASPRRYPGGHGHSPGGFGLPPPAVGSRTPMLHQPPPLLSFMPEDGADPAAVEEGQLAGGWLDLQDTVLTAWLLTRQVAELVRLVGAFAEHVSDEFLASPERLRSSPPLDTVRALVVAFEGRASWLGATVVSTKDHHEIVAQQASAHPRADLQSHSKLNEALDTLDGVLTVHMKRLMSDLHKEMYEAFVRMCAAYARWKRIYREDLKSKSAIKREAFEKRMTVVSSSRSARSARSSMSPRKNAKVSLVAEVSEFDSGKRVSRTPSGGSSNAGLSLPIPVRSTPPARPSVISFSSDPEAFVNTMD